MGRSSGLPRGNTRIGIPDAMFLEGPKTKSKSKHWDFFTNRENDASFFTDFYLVSSSISPPVPGLYGKAPTRQLHSNIHCCLWSDHNRKQSNSLALSFISKKGGARCRSPVSRLTSEFLKNAVHPSRDSPNTPRCFALGACNVCLVGEKPTSSVPA